MTSEVPVKSVNTQLVQGSTPTAATTFPAGGKNVPASGAPTAKPAPRAGDKAADRPVPNPTVDLHALVAHLNKHQQSSGRPNHYKLDSSAGRNVIQEINPDTRQVISELPASEFKALAQELGISGLLLDTRA